MRRVGAAVAVVTIYVWWVVVLLPLLAVLLRHTASKYTGIERNRIFVEYIFEMQPFDSCACEMTE